MDSSIKVRENRVRRVARRRGWVAHKVARRDRRALDYGRWWIEGHDGCSETFGSSVEFASLEEIERFFGLEG